jgi:mono/diheme cytochrome c family protein
LALAALTFQPSSGPAQEPTNQRMWSHFLAAADVQAAVIRGDLEATMEAATWLAEYDEPGLPDGAEAFLRELQRAAARVIEATTSEAAGAATGRIAAACGSCHREFYPGMETTKLVEPPPGEGDIAAHMARHGWAADRLWDGLALPSNAAWEAGADAFAGVPLATDDLAFDNPEGVRALANRTHELGRRAGLETEPSLRARTYGELLSTCAACHQMTGQQPAIEKLDW